MIYWMSDDTDRIMTECGIAVYGFDPEKDGANAACILELSDDRSVTVRLGDVRGMSAEGIDRLFREKMRETADGAGDVEISAVAEALERGGAEAPWVFAA